MDYKKEKITITLEGQEVDDLWDIIMFALDYHQIAIKSKPGKYAPLTDSDLKLANKLEELTRPNNV